MSAAEHLREVARRRTDHPLLVEAHGGRELTYGEALERAAALRGWLSERGIERGGRVAISMGNSSELAVLYLACLGSGLVAVPLAAGLGRRELREVLGRSRPAILLTDSSERPALTSVADELGIDTVCLHGAGCEVSPWSLPTSNGDPLADADDHALTAIHFTSGSTGLPRGVGHSLADFVGNAHRFVEATGLDDQCRFYHTLPMTYMAGYHNLLVLPFALGATVVLDRAFDAGSVTHFWEGPVTHDADVLWLVPTIAAILLKVDRDPRGPEHCRERVRHVACGTAPLDPSLRQRFEERYGTTLHDSWGLSETLIATTSTPDRPSPPRGVGMALEGVELRIDGDSPGEVLVSTPDLMLGYLEGCDEKGVPVFSSVDDEGWFATGDVGTLDPVEGLRITGRIKEVIIRGGLNVSALEVEQAFELPPGAERLAVVGAPHELLGEQIVAVVSCRDDGDFDSVEETLRTEAREVLEEGRRPDAYVQIDEMPLTPTGKVRKAKLADVVIDRLGLSTAAKGFRIDPAVVEGALGPRLPSFQGGYLVDLSHQLREGMTSFPSSNHPAPRITVLARHEAEGRATRRMVLGTHTGTHADAPLHFVPGGAAIDDVGLAPFVGLASVADIAPVEPLTEVGLAQLREALGGRPAHPRVLLHFGWSQRFVDQGFYRESPFLSEEACEWLVTEDVQLLGFDTPSPDDPRNGPDGPIDSPNHHLLLGAGVVLLEYLTNLDRLPNEVLLLAAPLSVAGADGAPVRALAIVPG